MTRDGVSTVVVPECDFAEVDRRLTSADLLDQATHNRDVQKKAESACQQCCVGETGEAGGSENTTFNTVRPQRRTRILRRVRSE